MADPGYIVDGVLTDGEAWVGIAHASLSLPAASVNWISTDDGQTGDFSQYMDLVVIAYTHGNQVAIYDNGYMRFNDDSGSNYPYQNMIGDGSAVTAGSGTSTGALFRTLGSSAGANEFSAWIGHVFDINSGKYKSVITQAASDSDGDGFIRLGANTWNSQAAINKVTLSPNTGNWPTGSVFDLFGILPRMVA